MRRVLLGVLLVLLAVPVVHASAAVAKPQGQVSTFFCYSGNFCGDPGGTTIDVFGFEFTGALEMSGVTYVGNFELDGSVATYTSATTAALPATSLHGRSKLGTVKGTCAGTIVFDALAPTSVKLACTGRVSGAPTGTARLVLDLTGDPANTDPLGLSEDGPTCVCDDLRGVYRQH